MYILSTIQSLFMKLQDMYELIQKEFQPLFKAEEKSTASQSEPVKRTSPT